MFTYISCCAALIAALFGIINFFLFLRENRNMHLKHQENETFMDLIEQQTDALQLQRQLLVSLQQTVTAQLAEQNRTLAARQDAGQNTQLQFMRAIDGKLHQFTLQNDRQLSDVRGAVETKLSSLQESNDRQLHLIRQTVDEKLQQTLENRLDHSFAQVSARLEQVFKGLGEMQILAANVGDLKKVLSNVKTRGVLGEVQLKAILEQIMAPGQFLENIITKRGSRNPVEFAIALPGDGETPLYLPVDAKFPLDAYSQLLEAQENGPPELVVEMRTRFSQRMRGFAKDINEKYLDPPQTTDFAILFLPFEGLYAQALQLGLFEPLQRDYKVILAGPTTMAALLNSLQMGFQTLAIQKRSSEVWQVLGAVKTEFERFSEVLGLTQQKLEQAGSQLDQLVGVRTRMIQKQLLQVSALPAEKAAALLQQNDK